MPRRELSCRGSATATTAWPSWKQEGQQWSSEIRGRALNPLDPRVQGAVGAPANKQVASKRSETRRAEAHPASSSKRPGAGTVFEQS